MAKRALLLLFCGLAHCLHAAYSQWDFAITTDSKILFYDEGWQQITSAAHQFDHLSAIAFDENEEIVYFSDELHNNGSIFSLKITPDSHFIDNVVQRTQNETIRSIVFDPLERNLYWTDIRNQKIYKASVDASETVLPTVFLDFKHEATLPDGLAIDFCRRTLYWTNSDITNATIERINLDGSNRKVIVHTDLYLPHGIAVDQLTDRIYWVVDQQAKDFWVESANLDGGDRELIVKGLNNDPYRLAVTKDGIYWTDLIHRAVWGHTKADSQIQQKQLVDPNKILTFNDRPLGIVTRTHFLTNLQNDEHCAIVVRNITARLLNPKPTLSPTDIRIQVLQREYCLNGGEYSEQSTRCICKIGFRGARCEVNECHNFCVHGTCVMSPLGFPACSCQKGFYGQRCQSYKCTGYCYNEGLCHIESNNEPTCECKDNFGGQRCEQNSTEICALFCRILKHEPEAHVPFGCLDICEELAAENGADVYAIPKYQHLEQVCKHGDTWTSTVIIVLVCSVVACLCLVLLIVHALRRFYKPARPRIKKTFVVRKQAAASSDTPLTNRPMATEQCEITIENCCNMNICDTPCFDPKLVQQTLSRNSNTKEDKKMLIHSMEDELY